MKNAPRLSLPSKMDVLPSPRFADQSKYFNVKLRVDGVFSFFEVVLLFEMDNQCINDLFDLPLWPLTSDIDLITRNKMTVSKMKESVWQDDNCILIKGARVNNLKNIDVRIPRDRFVGIYACERNSVFQLRLVKRVVHSSQKERERDIERVCA